MRGDTCPSPCPLPALVQARLVQRAGRGIKGEGSCGFYARLGLTESAGSEGAPLKAGLIGSFGKRKGGWRFLHHPPQPSSQQPPRVLTKNSNFTAKLREGTVKGEVRPSPCLLLNQRNPIEPLVEHARGSVHTGRRRTDYPHTSRQVLPNHQAQVI